MTVQVKMDVRDVRALTRRATREFSRVEDIMSGVVDRGARRLRRTDPYQNHTYNLRESTQGYAITLGPGEVEASLEMEMFYASFVIGRGFSNFNEVADDTEVAMNVAIDGIAKRIVG